MKHSKFVLLTGMVLGALLLTSCGMVPGSNFDTTMFGMSNPSSSSQQTSTPPTAPTTSTPPAAPTAPTQSVGNRSGHHSDPHHGTAATTTTTTTGTSLTDRDAIQIALQHAQVAESDTTFLHVEGDRENGTFIYEVEFYVGPVEYQYEIDANTGRILDFEAEKD